MAGTYKSTKFTSKHSSHDIFFDGALLSNTRASLVVELIKYFLYERQQIPLPVDELREQIERKENVKDHQDGHSLPAKYEPILLRDCEEKGMQIKPQTFGVFKSSAYHDGPLTERTNVDAGRNGHVDTNYESKAFGSKVHTFKSLHDRKTKVLVSNLTKLFDSLQHAFESCPEIEQVAVILGGTVMNPKESYFISFPPPSPEADCIPLLTCKRTLFQQIISEDILGTMSANISPTNMMVLVSAPRSCPLKGFLPKQSLRSPKTGSIICFNFHCNYLLPVCYDLTMGDGDFEMSGIEPLDIHRKERTVLMEKNILVEVCESDEIISQSDENRTQFLSEKEFDERGLICDYERHIQFELSRLKLAPGDEQFHVATPGINRSSQSVNLKGHLVSSTPVLKDESPVARPETIQMMADCIWYQSPLVIKGYRIADHNHSMCS